MKYEADYSFKKGLNQFLEVMEIKPRGMYNWRPSAGWLLGFPVYLIGDCENKLPDLMGQGSDLAGHCLCFECDYLWILFSHTPHFINLKHFDTINQSLYNPWIFFLFWCVYYTFPSQPTTCKFQHSSSTFLFTHKHWIVQDIQISENVLGSLLYKSVLCLTQYSVIMLTFSETFPQTMSCHWNVFSFFLFLSEGGFSNYLIITRSA